MNEKEIKTVELVLENLESVLFSVKDIVMLSINDIKKSIRFSNEQTSINLTANEIIIEINSKANLYSAYSHKWFDKQNESLLPFDRLMKYNDITAIELTYQDDSKDYIYANWPGDIDENNKLQSSKFDSDGNLNINISPLGGEYN